MSATSQRKRSEVDFMDRFGRFMPIRRFGWAFLLAWVFCVFYTGVVEGYTGTTEDALGNQSSMESIFFTGFPVFMSVIMLMLIVGLEKRLGPPTVHPALFWLAPLGTALSTPLLFLTAGEQSLTLAFFVFGALLTGFGSGFMWVMWGEYYAKISQEEVEFLAPISAVVAAVLVLLVSAMSGWIALVVVTALPLLSGLCFYLSWKDVQQQTTTSEHVDAFEQKLINNAQTKAKNRGSLWVLRSMGRAGLGILVACLFVCILGTYWTPDTHSFSFQFVLLASILFMVIVAFASTVGPRRISISFLYRWMCPVLVLGFVALILFNQDIGGYFAYIVSISARFAFCLITQMYFAQYAATGKATAVQSFGLGWIFVHLGDFLGVLLFIGAGVGIDAGMLTIEQVAAISIGVLVIITMFVLNDRKSFVVEDPEVLLDSDKMESALNTLEKGDKENSDDLEERIAQLAASYGLTPRETEVFGLLARGRSIPYVRDALVISKETAATHAKHIYAKLGVHSRQELISLVH